MAISVGSTVEGTVSGITDYGAFVRLGDGLSGMIHISKLSREFVSNVADIVKIGDKVVATVISNDNGRIALSLIPPRIEGKPDFESLLESFLSESEERRKSLKSNLKRKKAGK